MELKFYEKKSGAFIRFEIEYKDGNTCYSEKMPGNDIERISIIAVE